MALGSRAQVDRGWFWRKSRKQFIFSETRWKEERMNAILNGNSILSLGFKKAFP